MLTVFVLKWRANNIIFQVYFHWIENSTLAIIFFQNFTMLFHYLPFFLLIVNHQSHSLEGIISFFITFQISLWSLAALLWCVRCDVPCGFLWGFFSLAFAEVLERVDWYLPLDWNFLSHYFFRYSAATSSLASSCRNFFLIKDVSILFHISLSLLFFISFWLFVLQFG